MHTEGRQSRRDGISDGRGHGDYPALASALGAEWISGSKRELEKFAPDIREIGSGRQQIIHQRSREQLPMLIILQMLHEGASQSLDDRPNGGRGQ